MALTPEQVAKFRYDGYLYPVPALSPDQLAECNAGLARFEEWLGKPVNQDDWRWRSAAYVFLPWLDRLVRHPRILDAVESVIGPDILVFTSTFFIKEAHSSTFAAWHQDATYFGIEPYEHVTAWVALSDATEEAGCMEVVSSHGQLQQLHHAALGLKDSINGGDQAIVEDFDQGGGEMMALPAGSFSLTTLCAVTARRRTAPSIAALASASATSQRIAGSAAPCGCTRCLCAAAIPAPISTCCRRRKANSTRRRWPATKRPTVGTAPITPSRSRRTAALSPMRRASPRRWRLIRRSIWSAARWSDPPCRPPSVHRVEG